MLEPKFCHRHPTRIAKRKCFECSIPLCPECQLKLDHHLFCGNQCHRAYAARIVVNAPRPVARYALYTGSAVLIVCLFYFALLTDAFYNGGNEKSASSISQIAPSLPVQTNPSAYQQDEIQITRPLNGVKSPSQRVEVEGKAPLNSVVAVYLNGTLIDSAVAHSGFYRFPQVLLTKHANVIQTRYYAGNGSSDSSTAIMVFFQDTIASDGEDWKYFQNSADNIARGHTGRKEIVLTFDGGSEANSCESILTTLEKHNIRSTIFLTGEFIEKFPELTRKISQRHEVGNHTYSHDHLTTYAQNYHQRTAGSLTREELQNELRKTEEIYYHMTGNRMVPLWRAPYGEHNLEIRKWAAELGYVHVAWTANSKTRQNMDSLDWVPKLGSSGYFPALLLKDRILTFGQNEPEQANGSIILMHLGSQRQPGDRLDQWLPEIIKTFRQRGYTFITASQLIDHQDLLPQATVAKN